MQLNPLHLSCRELPARRRVLKFVEEARNHTLRRDQGVHDEDLSEPPCDLVEELSLAPRYMSSASSWAFDIANPAKLLERPNELWGDCINTRSQASGLGCSRLGTP